MVFLMSTQEQQSLPCSPPILTRFFLALFFLQPSVALMDLLHSLPGEAFFRNGHASPCSTKSSRPPHSRLATQRDALFFRAPLGPLLCFFFSKLQQLPKIWLVPSAPFYRWKNFHTPIPIDSVWSPPLFCFFSRHPRLVEDTDPSLNWMFPLDFAGPPQIQAVISPYIVSPTNPRSLSSVRFHLPRLPTFARSRHPPFFSPVFPVPSRFLPLQGVWNFTLFQLFVTLPSGPLSLTAQISQFSLDVTGFGRPNPGDTFLFNPRACAAVLFCPF